MMSITLRTNLLGRIFLPLLFTLFASQAQAYSYTGLYAFGDSLTDTGNVFAVTGGVSPPAPYYSGRFSNGPVWIETLAANLGLSINPSVLGGTNYAIGGAVTGPTLCSAIPNCTTPAYFSDMQTQLGRYNTDHLSTADPNALYVIWGGANDLRALGNPTASMSNAVTNIQTIISTLAGEGAKNFLVMNLPNVGLTPDAIAGGPGAVAFSNGLAVAFNSSLSAVLPGMASGLGVNINLVDVYSFLNGVVANPGAYGLTNINTKCFDATVPSICATPGSYLFWDGIHPTATAHAALGAFVTSNVPVPGAVWLFVSALSAVGVVRRKAA